MTKIYYNCIMNDGVAIHEEIPSWQEALKLMKDAIRCDAEESESFVDYTDYFIECIRETDTTTCCLSTTKIIPTIGPRGGIKIKQRRIY